MSNSQITRLIINSNKHMTVATADADGKPWISTVYYRHDGVFNFYWVSDKAALHSSNIRNRPTVAIVIFGPLPTDGSYDGVYMDCNAKELCEEAEVLEAMSVLNQGKQADKFMIKSLDDVSGGAAWRIYKAVPKEITKRADAIDKKSGQSITVREPVKL